MKIRCISFTVLMLMVCGNSVFAVESPGSPITMAAFGDRYCNPDQTFGDTWDSAWLADGRILLQYNDGNGFDLQHSVAHHDGICELKGEPEDLSSIQGVNLNPGQLGNFLGKTYSTGLYEVDNALYHLCCYSIQKPGAWRFFAPNIYKSLDGGITWLNQLGEKNHYIPMDISSAAFPDQRWERVNFVKYGRGGEAPDMDRAREFAYLTCGDKGGTYLARIRRAELSAWSGAFDLSHLEYYCGSENIDGDLDSNWTREISRCTFIHKKGDRGGDILTMVWNPGLKRYLATSVVSDSWQNPTVTSTLFIYEAPHPWGPWTEISSEYIEPRVGDNLTWFFLMQAFMSPDGTQMWATVSGRKPYGIQFLPIYLTTLPIESRMANQAELVGTKLGDAVKGSLSSGYIEGFRRIGDGCTFTFPVKTSGLYALRYRYHCEEEREKISLTINGSLHRHLKLGNTLQSKLPWNNGCERIWLEAGTATIQFHIASGDVPNGNLLLDRTQLALLSTVAEPLRGSLLH